MRNSGSGGTYSNFRRHAATRLYQKTYPDSTTVNYSYDLASRLTQVQDPTGTYAFTYDNMNRLTLAGANYLVDTQNPTGYAQVVDELVGGTVTRSYSYGLERISESQSLTAPPVYSPRP
jgi:YD repeat-containing protein